MRKNLMGDAAEKLMKRTGADVLQAVTGSASEGPKKWVRGGGLNQNKYKITTVRFNPEAWAWLQKNAFERALESGARPDASEIVRELVDAAMKREKK